MTSADDGKPSIQKNVWWKNAINVGYLVAVQKLNHILDFLTGLEIYNYHNKSSLAVHTYPIQQISKFSGYRFTWIKVRYIYHRFSNRNKFCKVIYFNKPYSLIADILVSNIIFKVTTHNYLVALVVQLFWQQGGIKFEISWEPNFPVNNFARNNGKNRIIIKTIINIKL